MNWLVSLSTLRHLAVAAALIPGASALLAPSLAAANSCSQCDTRYYLCNRGGASPGERACATERSICYMRCSSESYGAIAFSKRTGRHGFSFGHPGRNAAERRALAECASGSSASDCGVLTWFHDRCAALVVGDNRAYGSAQDASQEAASRKAIELCAQHGGSSCRVVREVCSR